MPEPLATSDDVADIWRPLTDAETDRVENLIMKASAMLRAACPFNIDERLALASTDPTNRIALEPAVVANIVAEIVKRVLVNPDGAAAASETVGPFSKATTFVLSGRSSATQDPQADTRGRLVVLASDLDALRPAVGFTEPFTIHSRPRHHHGHGYFHR